VCVCVCVCDKPLRLDCQNFEYLPSQEDWEMFEMIKNNI